MKVPYFTYMGSKYTIRDVLVHLFPRTGRRYVEPFAGRGNVFFLAKTQLDFETWALNDLYSARFLRAVRNVQDYSSVIGLTLQEVFNSHRFSCSEFTTVLEPLFGFGGNGQRWGFSKRLVQKNMSEYAENCLAARSLLLEAEISERNWQDVIDLKTLGPDDFVYLDPPYMNSHPAAALGYKEIRHTPLLEMLQTAKFRWALSGTMSGLYISKLGFPQYVFNLKGKTINNKKRRTAAFERKECLWTNLT